MTESPVIVDANVLVSAYAPGGVVREYWSSDAGLRRIIISPEIFTEVENYLRQKSLGFQPANIREILLDILDRCEVVRFKSQYKGSIPEENNRHLISLAQEVKAGRIVSADLELRKQGRIGGIAIVSPAEFFGPMSDSDDDVCVGRSTTV